MQVLLLMLLLMIRIGIAATIHRLDSNRRIPLIIPSA
jgi:hypothetical protein